MEQLLNKWETRLKELENLYNLGQSMYEQGECQTRMEELKLCIQDLKKEMN